MQFDQTLETGGKAGIDGLYVVSSRHTDANAPADRRFAIGNASDGSWLGRMGSGRRLDLVRTQCREMIRQASRYLEPCLKVQIPETFPCSNRHGSSLRQFEDGSSAGP